MMKTLLGILTVIGIIVLLMMSCLLFNSLSNIYQFRSPVIPIGLAPVAPPAPSTGTEGEDPCRQDPNPCAKTDPNDLGSRQTGTSRGTVPPQPVDTGSSKHLEPNGTFVVPSGWTCSGDITIDGNLMYDNNPTTGLVVHFTNSASIMAPWGADCSQVAPDIKVEELKRSGCGSSCANVVKLDW